jgi:hypothetical protein
LAQQLGKLIDLHDALELRGEQLKSRLSELFENLRQAYRLAQREFAFLHRREREARVARAQAKLEPDFSLSRDDLNRVAERSYPVLDLDVISNYHGYLFNWPYMHDPPTAFELVSASERLERQFENFEAELKP